MEKIPFQNWLADLPIVWKFRIVAIGFIVPLIILSFMLNSEQNISINFTEDELQGTILLRSVADIFYELIRFTDSDHGPSEFEQHRMNLDRLFISICSSGKQYEQSRAQLKKIDATWQNDSINYQNETIGKFPDLVRMIGNESKLILDSDLQSYYLMDLAVLKIPEQLLILHRIYRCYDTDGSLESCLPMLELLHRQTTKIGESAASAVHYIQSANIGASVQSSSNQISSLVRGFVESATINPKIHIKELQDILKINHQIWLQTLNTLDMILQERIQSLMVRKISTLGFIALIVILTAILFTAIAHQISFAVRELRQSANKVTDGDFDAQANISSRDELGQFAGIFNHMIRQLSGDIKTGTEQLRQTKGALDREIREHRQAEEALTKSEMLFRQVWDISVAGMRLTDEQGKIIAVNDSFCRVVGKDRSEIEGKPFPVVYHHDEREQAMKGYQRDLLNNALKTRFEQERKLWNGKTVWLEFSNSFLEISGSGKIVLSIINDVTQRKQAEFRLLGSEKRFKMLFNNANDFVFVNLLPSQDKLGNFIEVNDLICFRLGFTRQEFTHLNPETIISAKFHHIYEQAQNDLNVRKHALYEVELVGKDKCLIPVEISSHVFDYDDKPTVLSIARDITKRKEVEKKLERTSEKLRNLASRIQAIREEERRMIARELHDELGQVLTVLKIQISLLANKLTLSQKSERQRIESVLQEIDHTVESVQRITAKLRPGILDELGLVPALEWQSQEFEKQTGIHVDYSLPRIDIDLEEEKSTAIFRIFQEALTNIARHAQAKKVSVLLKQENGQLILEITDDGLGIRQSQIEDANSLGLLGMKERALILGGRVSIHGVSGKGTNVKVEMPQDGIS